MRMAQRSAGCTIKLQSKLLKFISIKKSSSLREGLFRDNSVYKEKGSLCDVFVFQILHFEVIDSPRHETRNALRVTRNPELDSKAQAMNPNTVTCQGLR